MNSSNIKTWGVGTKVSVFLRLGTLHIDPKEQIKCEVEGLITAPKLQLFRFQDARIRLKQAMAKKYIAPTAHLGKQKMTEVPHSKEASKLPLEGTSKKSLDTSKLLHGAQLKEIPCILYILSWGKTTGAVLARVGRLKEEIDRKELAHAVEAMKATLNDRNLSPTRQVLN
jgi:hypothetical protein